MPYLKSRSPKVAGVVSARTIAGGSGLWLINGYSMMSFKMGGMV